MNSGLGKNFRPPDFGESFVESGIRPGVTVDIGGREHFLSEPAPHIIHAPRIHAQTGGGDPASRDFGQAFFELVKRAEDVPTDGWAEFYGDIGEPVDFFEGEFSGLEGAEHDAPAFGTEVAGDVVGGHGAAILQHAPWKSKS